MTQPARAVASADVAGSSPPFCCISREMVMKILRVAAFALGGLVAGAAIGAGMGAIGGGVGSIPGAILGGIVGLTGAIALKIFFPEHVFVHTTMEKVKRIAQAAWWGMIGGATLGACVGAAFGGIGAVPGSVVGAAVGLVGAAVYMVATTVIERTMIDRIKRGDLGDQEVLFRKRKISDYSDARMADDVFKGDQVDRPHMGLQINAREHPPLTPDTFQEAESRGSAILTDLSTFADRSSSVFLLNYLKWACTQHSFAFLQAHFPPFGIIFGGFNCPNNLISNLQINGNSKKFEIQACNKNIVVSVGEHNQTPQSIKYPFAISGVIDVDVDADQIQERKHLVIVSENPRKEIVEFISNNRLCPFFYRVLIHALTYLFLDRVQKERRSSCEEAWDLEMDEMISTMQRPGIQKAELISHINRLMGILNL